MLCSQMAGLHVLPFADVFHTAYQTHTGIAWRVVRCALLASSFGYASFHRSKQRLTYLQSLLLLGHPLVLQFDLCL